MASLDTTVKLYRDGVLINKGGGSKEKSISGTTAALGKAVLGKMVLGKA